VILYVVYLLISALVLARLEIEIEGPHGWAEKLPTWRISNRWTRLLLGARPLTGYHFWLLIFVLLMVHVPMAVQTSSWSWGMELRVSSFYIFFWIVEDFLWFVINPAYGIRRFRPEHIWWHAKNWWWVMPRDYWVFGLIAGFAYAISWRVG
jgi:hypothetical protein